MSVTLVAVILYGIIYVVIAVAAVYLFLLLVKALKKYIASKEIREEKRGVCKSLGEVLKENRLRCKMTQEFVSEAIGVRRHQEWQKSASKMIIFQALKNGFSTAIFNPL